ncbi:MAG TPA: membrane fusion protein MtrC [Candidatus Binatia bacterium]|jgi:hypothetical protein|nr:membrane fusion protein MtrC [Candidatus Binatia bacterium]
MHRLVVSVWLLVVLMTIGCGGSPASTPAPTKPARVVTEDNLVTVELQPEAEQRLGIATAPVVMQPVQRHRVLAGELLLPLARPDGKASRSVFSLLPATTPTELIRVAEMQVDADGQVAAAQVQLDAAKVALNRAELLVDSKAGTKRGVDEAHTQVQLADAAVRTASQKRALLGTPVFDAVRTGALWVRVSVYAGDLAVIDRTAPAGVEPLGVEPGTLRHRARPIPVPLSAGTAPAMVDLFYEVDGVDEGMRPGQRVTVALPLRGDAESRVVPGAAVLYDIHGSAWVYVRTGDHTFTRTRVDVRWMDAGGAVLGRGPEPGAAVVTDGATELFGTEFGSGK